MRSGRLLSIFGLLIVGCSLRIDTAQLENDIKAGIEQQGYRIKLRSVICPSGIDQQTGVVFKCVAELVSDETFDIEVRQLDDSGNLDWTVPSSKVILNVATLETDIQTALAQEVGQRPAIDCGPLYRLNLPGESFECNVVGDPVASGDRIPAAIANVDTEGNLTWQEIRYPMPAANPTRSLESNAAATGASTAPTEATAAASTPATPADSDD
ncbi:DUF4333 domain-containing protein [Almyronema epifaneia]|uniref:DUF4333 domain-containing protein n=1 Tax=Almyronema epifaneia S1 TaxID=2991925 RepID=A0ABW6IHC1_9CYAN